MLSNAIAGSTNVNPTALPSGRVTPGALAPVAQESSAPVTAIASQLQESVRTILVRIAPADTHAPADAHAAVSPVKIVSKLRKDAPAQSLFEQSLGQSPSIVVADAPSFESHSCVATTRVGISPLGAAPIPLAPGPGADSLRQDRGGPITPDSQAALDAPSLAAMPLPSGTTSPAATVTAPANAIDAAGPTLIPAAAHIQPVNSTGAVSGDGNEPTQATDVPVRQLASPILSIAAGTSTGSTRTVTLTLRPAELGRVELRVTRTKDGMLAIRLSTETPETLALLRNDQAALDRALTQAGLTTDQRHLSFDLSAGGNGQQQAGDGGQSAEYQGRLASEPETEIGAPKTLQNLANARATAPTSQLDISI